VKPDDDGESLIELIVAMAILGTTMVTIIGGFFNLTKLSGIQKDQGRTFSTLSAASEYAKARPCMRTTTGCTAESSVTQANFAHDSDINISITARTPLPLAGGTSLYGYVVSVSAGSASYANTIVIRPLP
jgi:type II secretory pathway pseudopilin PulG